ITRNEQQAGEFLFALLSDIAARHQGAVERMEVEPGRFNVLAHWGEPVVTLSTHMDTVPPHIPSREDQDRIWGRGACDAKGIIASMIHAAEGLLQSGVRNFGLLFVVGEEKNSAGAQAAAKSPRGSRYLINGEPSKNQLALASKGALRFEITASGKMAHSAYPELGESAIEKLLDVLQRVRVIPMPVDPLLGPGTLNIGTIAGGRAPNVVPDSACAEIMIRLVSDPEPIRRAVLDAVGAQAQAREVACIPVVKLGRLKGLDTTVVAYTTDIPEFGGAWGKPFLLGPGSIHVAHTLDEHVHKRQLVEAVEVYQRMVKQLLTA
ncbi:MAG TPA: M20/M25/M40 family metallo-hydrolase, partial [Bryobacteraceae bacterium]|nr:M20/M25/M40 family metallo-hydrolase [Bryobacteraceae bacterium]